MEIVPGLFLGSSLFAASKDALKEKQIKYIVNVAQEIECFHKDDPLFSYLHVQLDDETSVQIIPEVSKVCEFLGTAKRENANALIHCQAGISRSSSFVIAYLMRCYAMTLRTAYFHVKERKPDIQPNSGFMAQLMQLDKEIFGSESFNLEDYLVDVLMQMGFEEGASRRALEISGCRFELAVSALMTMFTAALQVVSRFLHIASAATLCGGMQMLTAPEAKAVNGTSETWPLYDGFWVWDKSIAVSLLAATGFLNFFFIYFPAIKDYRGTPQYKTYTILIAAKTIIFIASAILTYVSPSITTLVAGFVGYVITILVAVIMKSVRESMKKQSQPIQDGEEHQSMIHD